MIFTKGAHQSAKIQTFDCSGEISPNLYFDRLLLLKVYKISAKKVQRSYLSRYWRVMQNLKKNQVIVSKMARIWWILIRALWLVPFMQTYNVWPTKVQRSYLSKFEEKLTCGLENDMRNLANFHQNTWKCQNWYFHGILLSKVENAWAKNLQRSYV